jgi:SAM-dependent methyltransferase
MNTSPECRACGSSNLQLILALGRTPLANALLTAAELDQPEDTYPLDLVFCPTCSLVQISETVAPEKLFSEYLYFSSFSNTMLSHAQKVVHQILESRSLGPDSLAIEIASNDGYLLQFYREAGVPVLGIEPAINVAQVAEETHGIPTLNEYFNSALARRLVASGRQADVIHANNVLAHVPDLNGFVSGLQLLLKDDGICVIEAPYVKDLVDGCEFDTIYHEHLCYFSLIALNRLFDSHRLVIQDVELLSIHGGTLRLFVTQKNGAEKGQSVSKLIAQERAEGLDKFHYYEGFARRVEQLKTSLQNFIYERKQERKSLAAYGAAAKGSTLLNYFGIGRDSLDFVVDRSPHKQGLYMPGVRLPIYAPEKLLQEMPSYVLLLTWNFADEILEQQAEYRQRGGRFIIPIPELRVV